MKKKYLVRCFYDFNLDIVKEFDSLKEAEAYANSQRCYWEISEVIKRKETD